MRDSISINDFLKLSNPNIIDIRSPLKYMQGHIPGAINLDASYLHFNPERYLKKDVTYYLYCDSGKRSYSLVKRLIQNGYHCVNIDGGYHNYLFQK